MAIDPIGVQNQMRSMMIGPLEARTELPGLPRAGSTAATGEPSFADMVTHEIEKVNTQMVKADASVADLAAGRSGDVHGTMIELQKANLSFKMLVEVRNKALRAYEEIMRMQA